MPIDCYGCRGVHSARRGRPQVDRLGNPLTKGYAPPKARLDGRRPRQTGDGARQLACACAATHSWWGGPGSTVEHEMIRPRVELHLLALAPGLSVQDRLAGRAGASVPHRRAKELPARLICRAACA
jgi:hypothetical protein